MTDDCLIVLMTMIYLLCFKFARMWIHAYLILITSLINCKEYFLNEGNNNKLNVSLIKKDIITNGKIKMILFLISFVILTNIFILINKNAL